MLRTILILSLALWASLIVLAIYEWKWLVVAALVALVFVFRGIARQQVPSRRWPTTTKEDDTHEW